MAKNEKQIINLLSETIVKLRKQCPDLNKGDFNAAIKEIVLTNIPKYNRVIIQKPSLEEDNDFCIQFFGEAIESGLKSTKKSKKVVDNYQVIKKYIDDLNITDFSSSKDAIKFLVNITELLKKSSNSLETKIQLLNENEMVSVAIKKIFVSINESKEKNKTDFLNKIIHNDAVQELIDIYMSLNSLEFAEETIEFNDDIVAQYLKDISRYPLLDAIDEHYLGILSSEETSEQERKEALDELKKRTAANNKKLSVIKAKTREEEIKLARNDFVTHNLKLSVHYSRRFIGNGIDYMDIISSGNLGLAKAAEKFDYKKSIKFSTYAIWWIRQSIMKEIQNNGKLIRKPAYIEDKIRKYKKAYAILSNEKEPTDEDLLKYLGEEWSKADLLLIRTLTQDLVSLDSPVGEDEDSTLGEFIPSNENVEDIVHKKIMSSYIEEILENSSLDEKHKTIIKKRYGIGYDKNYTLEEIAKEYNVTRERIRQIERNSLCRLRKTGILVKLKRASSLEINSYKTDNKETSYKKTTPKNFEVRKYLYGIKSQNKEDMEWNRYYLILSAYVRNYGKLEMPYNFVTKDGKKYDENGYNIYQWLREQYNKCENGLLPKDKLDALTEIGFIVDYKNYMMSLFKSYSSSTSDLTENEKQILMEWIFDTAEQISNTFTTDARIEQLTLEMYGFNISWIINLKKILDLLRLNKNPYYFDEYFENYDIPAIPGIDWAREQYKLYKEGSLSKLESDLIEYVLKYRQDRIKNLENQKEQYNIYAKQRKL